MPISFFLFVACKLSGNVLCLLEIEELWNRTKEKEEEKKKKERMRKLVNDWRERVNRTKVHRVCSISVCLYRPVNREKEKGEKRETKEK